MSTTEQAVRAVQRFHRLKPSGRSFCGAQVGYIIESRPVDEVPDADRCRRCWNRPVGARLERSSLQQRQGIRAKADGGTCDRCDQPILKEQRIVPRGEHWIHASCATGQEDA